MNEWVTHPNFRSMDLRVVHEYRLDPVAPRTQDCLGERGPMGFLRIECSAPVSTIKVTGSLPHSGLPKAREGGPNPIPLSHLSLLSGGPWVVPWLLSWGIHFSSGLSLCSRHTGLSAMGSGPWGRLWDLKGPIV